MISLSFVEIIGYGFLVYVAISFILERIYPMSNRRKLAIATWNASTEANAYTRHTINVENALKFLEKVNEKHQGKVKVTMTHLIGKAVAMAMASSKGVNGRIVFGTYLPHKTLDISFLVAIGGESGKDLGKVVIRDINNKSVAEIAQHLSGRSSSVKSGKDKEHNAAQPLLRFLPTPIIKIITNVVGFLVTGVGIALPGLGLDANPFGCAVITNIGVFDVEEGIAPPTPFTYSPLFLCVGAIRTKPYAEEVCSSSHDAQKEYVIVPRKQMVLNCTIDHRFLDGAQGATISRVMTGILEHPEEHLANELQ